MTYIAKSHEYASVNVRGNPPGGMPGGFCSGSSNGADPDSAILVCTIPYGDANANVVNGRLLVYDPVHLAADGSLKVLWDSQALERPVPVQQIRPAGDRRRPDLRAKLQWRCRSLPVGAIESLILTLARIRLVEAATRRPCRARGSGE